MNGNSYPSRESIFELLSLLYPEDAVDAADEFLAHVENSIRKNCSVVENIFSDSTKEALLHLEGAREMLDAYKKNIFREIDGTPLLEIFDDGVYAMIIARGNSMMSDTKEEMRTVIARILSDIHQKKN